MNGQRSISSIIADRFAGLVVSPADEARIKETIEKNKIEEVKKRVVDTRKSLNIPSWWSVEQFQGSRWPDMAWWIKEGDPKRNLLIAGPTNVGKSHAACALALRAAAENEVSVFRLREHAFYPLWDQARYHDSGFFRDVVEKAKRADILIYDDLGKVEIAREYSLTPFGCILFDIFDERAERRKTNFVTTRYPSFALLKKATGDDFIRRILQHEGDDLSRGKIIVFRQERISNGSPDKTSVQD